MLKNCCLFKNLVIRSFSNVCLTQCTCTVEGSLAPDASFFCTARSKINNISGEIYSVIYVLYLHQCFHIRMQSCIIGTLPIKNQLEPCLYFEIINVLNLIVLSLIGKLLVWQLFQLLVDWFHFLRKRVGR